MAGSISWWCRATHSPHPPAARVMGPAARARPRHETLRRSSRNSTMPAPRATPIERVSSASAAARPARPAAATDERRAGGASARITANATRKPKSGSEKRTACIASIGIASPAAITSAAASHGGASGPSRSVRVACQVTRPVVTALSARFKTLASNPAVDTENIPNRGASTRGYSGG